jgi:hypothetical protein
MLARRRNSPIVGRWAPELFQARLGRETNAKEPTNLQLSIVEGQLVTTQRKSGHNRLWLCGLEVIGSGAGERTAGPTIDHIERYGIWSLATQITGGQIAQ